MTDQDAFFAALAKELTKPDVPDDWQPPTAPPRRRLPDTSGPPLGVITETTGPARQVVSQTFGPARDLVSAVSEQSEAEDFEDEDTELRPCWDAYLRPADPTGELQSAITAVQFHLDRAEVRVRARRPKDAALRAEQIAATVCSLAKALQRGGLSLRIPMRDGLLERKSRYKSPLQTAALRTVVHQLVEEGFMTRTEDAERPRSYGAGLKFRGSQAGYKSSLRLATLLQGVSLSDIARLAGDEIVLLRSKRDEAGLTELVEYTRTPSHVSAARAELVELNAFRAAADIECLGSPERFDVSDRNSRRRWTRSSWYCGGRHWGGFWQTMRKAERLNLIRIDGEPVVGIDYTGTIVTLAYAAVGQRLPEGDPYAFPLADRDGREVSSTRKQRKTIFIAAMNGAKEWPRELRALFRTRISWQRTLACLKQAHPRIAVYFDADKGQDLAFTEANIMASVLKALRARGVVALDMFDCVLVKGSAVEQAREVMLQEFHRIAGMRARVTLERPEDHPMVHAVPASADKLAAAADF